MGNWKAVLRKPRRDAVTKDCEKLFSKAISQKDYNKAGAILLYNVLKVYGKKGILSAMYDANRFILRKERRRGL